MEFHVTLQYDFSLFSSGVQYCHRDLHRDERSTESTFSYWIKVAFIAIVGVIWYNKEVQFLARGQRLQRTEGKSTHSWDVCTYYLLHNFYIMYYSFDCVKWPVFSLGEKVLVRRKGVVEIFVCERDKGHENYSLVIRTFNLISCKKSCFNCFISKSTHLIVIVSILSSINLHIIHY